MEWLDNRPDAAGKCMYVGVPDYANDKWVWRGPATSASDIMDFAGAAVTGNPERFGRSKIALVNYSQSTVKLKYFNFTTDNPADQSGDEQIFFVTRDSGSFAINSASADDLDSTQPVI